MNKGYEVSKDKLREYGMVRAIQAREKYEANPKLCPECGTPISYKRKNDAKFCNSSCFAKYSNKNRAVKNFCNNCGIQIVGKKYLKFCSQNCGQEFRYKKNLDEWLSGLKTGNHIYSNGDVAVTPFVRRWCLDRCENKCEECGWDKIHPITGKRPLQIHHINGDAYNSRPENLKVLCPNCHSLTPTYGNLNKGSGRKGRHMVV